MSSGKPQPSSADSQFMPEPAAANVLSAGPAPKSESRETGITAQTAPVEGADADFVFVDASLFRPQPDAYVFNYVDVDVPEWQEPHGRMPPAGEANRIGGGYMLVALPWIAGVST